MTMQTINIIGAGKVGKVLAQQFHRHQIFTIQDVLNRTLAGSLSACEFIGGGNALSDYAAMRPSHIYLIAAPDDQIKACSLKLQEYGLIKAGTIVFHCSGALSSAELGLKTGAASLHPLRSFADPVYVAQHFVPTICTLEGDNGALGPLSNAAQKIGAQVVAIDRKDKTLYHAAAVFASNYLVTLMDAALQTFVAAGIPAEMAMRMTKPLAQETFNNVFRLGAQHALTGPIARGDNGTVERHHAALREWDEGFAALYSEMANATRKMKDRK